MVWKIDRKIHVNIEGEDNLVKIKYDKTLKKPIKGYATNCIVLRVPPNFTDEEIEKRLNQPYYKKWLQKEKEYYKDTVPLYEEGIRELGFELEDRTLDEFKEIVEKYVKKYEDKFIRPKQITYRSINGVWGRCSKTKDKLTFNPVLKYLSEEYIEYIVYHEMAHTYCLNHNPPFQRKIEERYPNWKEMDYNFLFWIYLLQKMIYSSETVLLKRRIRIIGCLFFNEFHKSNHQLTLLI